MWEDGNLTTSTNFKKAKTYSWKSFLKWYFPSSPENWRRPKYVPGNHP